MKRKFSFGLRPIKVLAVPPALPTPEDTTPSDLAMVSSPEPSPDFRPASPLVERRGPLSASIETALREACIEILRAQDPTMQLYEDMKNSEQDSSRRVAKTVKKFESQTAVALKNNRRPASETRKSRATTRPEYPPLAAIPGGPAATTFKHVPQNAASSFNQTATSRSASLNRGRSHAADSLEGATIQRPHTAQPRTQDSSFTTTSTMTWGTSDRHTRSTGVSTMASGSHTPATGKLGLEEQARADARARAWMADELARRRAEQDRPPSRGSRIADYLRPRSSRESLRSSYSIESSGNSGGTGGSSWWRGSSLLRRNNSTSSYRSNHRAIYDEVELPPHEIDLNRALPPLPSLDTWQSETTETSVKGTNGVLQVTQVTTHRPQSGMRSKLPDAIEVSLAKKNMTAAELEDVRRQQEFEREIEESMRIGSIEFPLPLSVGVSRSTSKLKKRLSKDTKSPVLSQTEDKKPEANKAKNSPAGPTVEAEKKKKSLLRRSFGKLGFGSHSPKSPKSPTTLQKPMPKSYEIIVEDRGTPLQQAMRSPIHPLERPSAQRPATVPLHQPMIVPTQATVHSPAHQPAKSPVQQPMKPRARQQMKPSVQQPVKPPVQQPARSPQHPTRAAPQQPAKALSQHPVHPL